MNLGLDCPCLINEGGRGEEGASGTDWLISPLYSALKEDRGRGVKADLNQELNVDVNFVDVQ